MTYKLQHRTRVGATLPTPSSLARSLAANAGWLLILDNADDLAMVKEYMPSPGKGHMLLTTRAQVIGRLAQRVEIEKMGLEEGALFLLRRASIIASDAPPNNASLADIARAKEIAGGNSLAVEPIKLNCRPAP